MFWYYIFYNNISPSNSSSYHFTDWKSKLPTHIEIGSTENGLKSDSIVLAEQIRTIDKSRLKEKIGHIDDEAIISKVNNALGVSFGLED